MEVNKTLLEKYYRGHCNKAEQQAVEEWLMAADGFAGNVAPAGYIPAKQRMWRKIRPVTVGLAGIKTRRYIAVAAGVALLLTSSGFYVWGRFQRVPGPDAYVVIDNTRSRLLSKRNVGDILVSESANSGWQHMNGSGMVYTNSLIINNQNGEDVWVYLKTSSESGSKMVKFLCKGRKTYVAGFITEHTGKGMRKFLYSSKTETAIIPKNVASSMNSQLNAAMINAKQRGHTTVII